MESEKVCSVARVLPLLEVVVMEGDSFFLFLFFLDERLLIYFQRADDESLPR